jgi:hypothetical protein
MNDSTNNGAAASAGAMVSPPADSPTVTLGSVLGSYLDGTITLHQLDQRLDALFGSDVRVKDVRNILVTIAKAAMTGVAVPAEFLRMLLADPKNFVQPSPEAIARALQEYDEAEIASEVRKLRDSGGLQLCDFVHELEAEVIGNERIAK